MKRKLLSLLSVMTVLAMMTGAAVAEGSLNATVSQFEDDEVLSENTIEEDETTDDESEEPVEDEEQALEDAMEAYFTAKEAERLQEFEQELDEMVANQQLTREQADILLEAARQGKRGKRMCGNASGCGMDKSRRIDGRGGRGREARDFGMPE